jgi:hypothetical protein
MRRPKLKLTLLAALTLASCSQILGIDDYEIDDKLDRAAGGDGNQAGQGNGGGSDGGSNSQAGEPNNLGGDGGTPQGGSAGSGGTAGTDDGGAGAAGDGGGPPVGELIPCDSVDCCAAADGVAIGTELLSDGGFEAGTVANGEGPWTKNNDEGEGITSDLELGWTPKSGDYYAYLSGIAGERMSLYSEDLEIPADAGWFVVSGYRWFQIDAQDDVNEDFGLVGFFGYPVDPEEDALKELPFYWTKPSESGDGWGDTMTWTRFTYSWDAEPHQETVRYLALVGESDLYPADPDPTDEEPGDASSYLFDDVSLKVFRCYEKP